jgi:hypothetical protein
MADSEVDNVPETEVPAEYKGKKGKVRGILNYGKYGQNIENLVSNTA